MWQEGLYGVCEWMCFCTPLLTWPDWSQHCAVLPEQSLHAAGDLGAKAAVVSLEQHASCMAKVGFAGFWPHLCWVAGCVGFQGMGDCLVIKLCLFLQY
jgi:hypothetical protein